MRRYRSWQELAEGDRKVARGIERLEPVGLLSDPMGVSLLAGFNFGFGYDFSHGYKSDSGVTA